MNGLGRLHAPDARDHLMRTMLPPLVKPLPSYKFWQPGKVLDQGQTPECVAYAWTGWELGAPLMDSLAKIDPPDKLYSECQAVDEWAGQPHDGTSVRAGAKVMQSERRIGEYVFDNDVEVVRRWILTKGPVVFGTNWYEDMFTPRRGGYMDVGGALAGGHAYLVYGYYTRQSAFLCRNSWGPTWGWSGNFWLRADDARRLLTEDGEAAAAVEVAV